MKRLASLSFILFLGSHGIQVHGQTPDMNATLNYVNELLGSSFQIIVDRGYMNVSYYQDNELFREDNAACRDLDINSIDYNKEDMLFSLNCRNGKKCVLRIYYLRKIRRDYNRISFYKQLSESEAAKLKSAFIHIINMVNDVNYRGTIYL